VKTLLSITTAVCIAGILATGCSITVPERKGELRSKVTDEHVQRIEARIPLLKPGISSKEILERLDLVPIDEYVPAVLASGTADRYEEDYHLGRKGILSIISNRQGPTRVEFLNKATGSTTVSVPLDMPGR
jgi:hypothetical protein